MNIKGIDETQHPADKVGVVGRAWRVNTDGATKPHASVADWVVYQPHANPIWRYYWVSCIHLRPEPGLPDATIRTEGATHQLVCLALDPDFDPPLVVAAAQRMHWLEPMNHNIHWKAAARPNPVDLDRAAAEKTEKIVDELIAGTLCPEGSQELMRSRFAFGP